jgi:hypothetical protein
VASSSVSGHRRWRIEAELPDGLIGAGTNQIQLRFTTEYIFSLIVVDSFGLEYRTPYHGPDLDFAPDPSAHGYRIDGFPSPAVVAYLDRGAAGLSRHQPSIATAPDGYTAEIRQNHSLVGSTRTGGESVSGRFWVTDAPHRPAVFTTRAPDDLFSGEADLVVITGSSFTESGALESYLVDTAAYNPVVVDVEDIYNALGYGMALPSAITDYLAARRTIRPFSHVQLVGSDCWDRRNFVSSCISFVPLPTAVVTPTHYSPSHNRLVDLDGDGISDVAVGQFSVRTEDELQLIVDKGRRWYDSGLAAGDSALLIAEESDGKHDFLAQVSRVGTHLSAGDKDVLDMAAHPDIATAREALRSSLDAGRSVTVFSGHSSALIWAYRGLLTPSTVAGLTNVGAPTLMLPLACETSYDISPSADVLGHQLLYAGDQGALAISGAVSLANIDDNGVMADHVLNGLESGMTLGEAVQAGRSALGAQYQTLLDNWLTQGDVTLRMDR